jgi:potassium-dependent mechanosensitive channel
MGNEKNNKVQTLKNTGIFRELPERDLEELSAHMTSRSYPAGVTILREGTRGSAMFIIGSGEIEIKKKKPELGIDLTIARLGPGDIFGEMALLTGALRSATVITATSAHVLVLKKEDFAPLVLQNPRIAMLMNVLVDQRLASMKAQFSECGN